MSRITLHLTEPMKMDFQDIELNKLTLLTGMNGTGKSFIMKNVWATAMIASSYQVSPQSINTDFAQYIYDNTFSGQNLNGAIWSTMDNGMCVKLGFEKGKVLTCTVTGAEGAKPMSQPVYMSSSMRTFSAMNWYLQERSLITGTMNQKIEGLLNKGYKLFDILCIERLIAKMPITVDSVLEETIKPFEIREKIKSFGVEREFFWINDKDERFPMTWFGSGHQSLLNMLLVNHSNSQL